MHPTFESDRAPSQAANVVEAERIRVLGMVRAARDQYHPKFPDWLLVHYDMWLAFKEAADKVRAHGRTQYSPYVIVNVLRYRADTHGTQFSMTNTLVPDLARLYNADHGPLFKTSTRFGRETSNAT